MLLFLDEPTIGLDPQTCSLRRAQSRSPSPSGEAFVPRPVAELGLPIKSVSVSRPTLDDVFMSYTGTTIRDAEESQAGQADRIRMRVIAGGRR